MKSLRADRVFFAVAAACILITFAILSVRPLSHQSPVTSIAFSPDGRMLAVSSQDGQLRLWAYTGAATPVVALGAWRPQSLLNSVAFSPDSQSIVCSGENLELVDVKTRRTLRRLETNGYRSGGSFGSVRFSPDGQLLAAITATEDVLFWETRTWRVIFRFQGPTALYGDLAFSPDGQFLASTGHRLQMWSLRMRTLVRTFDESSYTYGPVAFSPDGRVLATGSQDRALKLWDVATGKRTFSSENFPAAVEGVAFDAQGQRVAASGGQLRILEVSQPQRVERWGESVRGPVAFSPEGANVVVAGANGRVYWRHVTSSEQPTELK